MGTNGATRSAQQVLLGAFDELESREAMLLPFEQELADVRDAKKAVDSSLKRIAQRRNQSVLKGSNRRGVGRNPRVEFKERIRRTLAAGPLTLEQLQQEIGSKSADFLANVVHHMAGSGDVVVRDGVVKLTELGMPETAAT